MTAQKLAAAIADQMADLAIKHITGSLDYMMVEGPDELSSLYADLMKAAEAGVDGAGKDADDLESALQSARLDAVYRLGVAVGRRLAGSAR